MTTGPDLKNCRILIVEDEYVIADLLASELAAAGAIVVGPVGTLPQALRIVEAEDDVDAAVLDVNLGGKKVFPVADILSARQIPFVFLTGYDPETIPGKFARIGICDKSDSAEEIMAALDRALRDGV